RRRTASTRRSRHRETDETCALSPPSPGDDNGGGFLRRRPRYLGGTPCLSLLRTCLPAAEGRRNGPIGPSWSPRALSEIQRDRLLASWRDALSAVRRRRSRVRLVSRRRQGRRGGG